MPESSSKRGTRLLGPGESGDFSRIEHKDILSFISNNSSDVNVDSLSDIEAVLNGTGGFSGEKPILMFPLRLETRYVTENGTDKLKIRIFPDDVIIRRHEKDLTQLEADHGVLYWEAVFQANGNIQEEKEAWEKLVKSHGVERAAWIRKDRQPNNWPLEDETHNSNVSRNEGIKNAVSNAITNTKSALDAINELQKLEELISNAQLEYYRVDLEQSQTDELIHSSNTTYKNYLQLELEVINGYINRGLASESILVRNKVFSVKDQFCKSIRLFLGEYEKNTAINSEAEILIIDFQQYTEDILLFNSDVKNLSTEFINLKTDVDRTVLRLRGSGSMSYQQGVNFLLAADRLLEVVSNTYYSTGDPYARTPNGDQTALNSDFLNLKTAIEIAKAEYNSYSKTALVGAHSSLVSVIDRLEDLNFEMSGVTTDYTNPTATDQFLGTIDFKLTDVDKLLKGGSTSQESINVVNGLLINLTLTLGRIYDQQFNPIAQESDPTKGRTNASTDTIMNGILDSLFDIYELVETYTPTAGPPIPSTPDFPSLGTIKEKNWTIQEYTDMLPDRLVAVGYKLIDPNTNNPSDEDDAIEKIDFVKVSNQIANVATGFSVPTDDVNEDLSFEVIDDEGSGEHTINAHPSLKWMTEFDIALADGLALEIINPVNYYSRIVVFGVKDKNIGESEDLINSLFEDHQYTDGLSLLVPDTPTNNTEEQGSEYSSDQTKTDKSFNVHANGELFQLTRKDDRKTDGQRFCEAIGLSPELFYNVQNADSSYLRDSLKLRKVLFPGTLGQHLEEMWHALITKENLEEIEEYFVNEVFPMGSVPGFRVGSQPYGLIVGSKLHDVSGTSGSYDFVNHNGFRFIGEDDELSNGSLDFDHIINQTQIIHDEVVGSDTDYRVDYDASEIKWDLRFVARLREFLKHLELKYREIAQENTKNVYTENTSHFLSATGITAQQHFLDLLRLSPYSVEYYARPAIATELVEMSLEYDTNWSSALGNEPFVQAVGYEWLTSILYGDVTLGSQTIPSGFPQGLFHRPTFPIMKHLNPNMVNQYDSNELDFLYFIKSNKAFSSKYLATVSKLEGGISKDAYRDTDSVVPISTWLTGLVSRHPKELLSEIHEKQLFLLGANGLEPSNSLFYMVMRNSILHKYKKEAFRILEQDGLLDRQSFQFMNMPENRIIKKFDGYGYEWLEKLSSDYEYSSQWNVLFSAFHVEQMLQHLASILNPDSYPNILGLTGNYGFTQAPYTSFNPLGSIESFTLDAHLANPVLANLMFMNGNSIGDLTEPFNTSLSDADRIYSLADFLYQNYDQDSELKDRITANNLRTPPYYTLQSGPNSGPLNKINEIKAYVNDLANQSEDLLNSMFSSTLDVATFRLDAWISGLFSKKLFDHRSHETIIGVAGTYSYNKGSYIGAYGYVESLSKRISSGTEPITESYGLPVTPENTTKDLEKDGFIQGLSVDHGITAAVLRSGYLSSVLHEHSELTNRMAISLTSKRVRMALSLLDGVRNGQDIEHLLGYRIEEELFSYTNSDSELNALVGKLRKKFPNDLETSSSNASSNSNYEYGNVCNGLAILESLTLSGLIPNQSLSEYLLNDTASKEQLISDLQLEYSGLTAFNNELGADAIDNLAACLEIVYASFDAFADLAISEGVYQIVKGNAERANAYMTMMGGGRTLIEPEIVKTQKTGLSFKQRMVCNVDFVTSYSTTSGWSETTILADLNPSINQWLQSVLVPSANTKILVRYDFDSGTLDEDNQPILTSTEQVISVDDLNIQPIDLISILENDPSKGNYVLDCIIHHHIYLMEPGAINLEIDHSDTSTSNGTDVSLCMLIDYYQNLWNMIAQSEATKAAEFYHDASKEIDETNRSNFDLVELRARFDSVLASLVSLDSEITTLLAGNDNGLTQAAVFGVAKNLASLGIPNLLKKKTYSSIEVNDLKDQIAAVQLILQERISRANDQLTELDSESNLDVRYGLIQELVKNTIGNGAKIFPKCSLYPPNNEPAFDPTINETDGIEGWLDSLEPVRSKMSMLSNCQLYGSSLEVIGDLDVKMFQLPQNTDDVYQFKKWDDSENDQVTTQGERVSIGMINSNSLTNTSGFTSLLIDEWNEFIPTPGETGAVSFNYDSPNAEAPQALILAVPPGDSRKWNSNDVLHTILETIDMSKYRGLRSDILYEDPELAQLLGGATSQTTGPTATATSPGDITNYFNDRIEVNLDLVNNNKEKN
ncbi:MAG: hypothetical protein AB8B53_13285 [Flavobacteriales bacterium]